jgi:hypothetical protein
VQASRTEIRFGSVDQALQTAVKRKIRFKSAEQASANRCKAKNPL